ncbi:Kinesin light chain 2, partial [Durusdinium trenchii]
KLEVQQAKKAPQLVSNSGVESSTGWRVAATVNEMEAAELEDFVVNLSKSTCRALQKAIGARLEAEVQEDASRASGESEDLESLEKEAHSSVREEKAALPSVMLQVPKVEHSKASLKDYFEKNYKQGRLFDHEEYRHDPKDWCWVHTALDVKVWQDALDLTQASDASDVQCLFHYTNEFGFKNITDLRKTAVELFAMPSAFMNLM